MSAVCRIVCAGDFEPRLLPAAQPGDFLIAADAGLRHLKRAGRTPDLCVGDFDSLGAAPPDGTGFQSTPFFVIKINGNNFFVFYIST